MGQPILAAAGFQPASPLREDTLSIPIALHPSRDRQGAIATFALFTALFATLYFFTPPDLPVCAFRWLTGYPCPLCGLTHAVFALAKGRIGEAIHLHPLSPLAIVMLAGTFWNARRMTRIWGPCLAAFGVYGLWRIAF
uniref:DUF2752 domain-containing protein n=1 Tax=Solibacter usitatus (strain Ellin6076) TaxID=234267 RepID=Q01UY2_SOLUE